MAHKISIDTAAIILKMTRINQKSIKYMFWKIYRAVVKMTRCY